MELECNGQATIAIKKIQFANQCINLLDENNNIIVTINSFTKWCTFTKNSRINTDIYKVYDKMREYGWI